MEALLTNLAHATKDYVLYGAGIDSAAIDQRIQHFSCHISRMPIGEFSGAATTGCPDRLDNVCVHTVLSR
jgi:hypothetical protein